MPLCYVTLYNLYSYYFALSTERTWFDYISLLIIPCITIMWQIKKPWPWPNRKQTLLIQSVRKLQGCFIKYQHIWFDCSCCITVAHLIIFTSHWKRLSEFRSLVSCSAHDIVWHVSAIRFVADWFTVKCGLDWFSLDCLVYISHSCFFQSFFLHHCPWHLNCVLSCAQSLGMTNQMQMNKNMLCLARAHHHLNNHTDKIQWGIIYSHFHQINHALIP